ncbi:hypothetical protein LAZ67_6000543 [Cordylochernes scorpioides]|uniref:Uncharacterized protein n=1 Tax=Cordylochernes scorpioides TaxID=51811 RepID=A0ABY6KMF1_9ARAC|nr:hypothetical protein LAZ67_6000543 [Cordylochernes scorpioides]
MWTWRKLLSAMERYEEKNVSILSEIKPIRTLESRICKQRLTHFGNIIIANSLEKMLKNEEGKTCNELARRIQESYYLCLCRSQARMKKEEGEQVVAAVAEKIAMTELEDDDFEVNMTSKQFPLYPHFTTLTSTSPHFCQHLPISHFPPRIGL